LATGSSLAKNKLHAVRKSAEKQIYKADFLIESKEFSLMLFD